MELLVLAVIGGIVLIVSGIRARLRPAEASPLPPAKIEDGQPVPPPAGQRRPGAGTGRIVFGSLIVILVGGFIALILSIPVMGSLGRPLRVGGRPRRAGAGGASVSASASCAA